MGGGKARAQERGYQLLANVRVLEQTIDVENREQASRLGHKRWVAESVEEHGLRKERGGVSAAGCGVSGVGWHGGECECHLR